LLSSEGDLLILLLLAPLLSELTHQPHFQFMRQLTTFVFLLVFALGSQPVQAQASEVKQAVDALCQVRRESLLAGWRTANAEEGIDISHVAPPVVRFDIYVDEQYTTAEELNSLSFTQVSQIALSFDPKWMVRGGAVGYNGVILITRNKVTSK
jgi:hypothetical protein